MDLAQMIVQFANSFSVVMWRLLWALSALVGTLYVARSIMRLGKAAALPGQSAVSLGDVLPVILIGGLMFNLSSFINATWNSFGTGMVSYGPISYSGAAAFGRFTEAINAVLTLGSLFGGFFFFRGVLLLKKAAVDGQSPNGGGDFIWKAITHMVAGAMLVQVDRMIEAFRASFNLFW